MPSPRILVTGGAGFIGSNLVRLLIHSGHEVLNFDKLTYAGNVHSLTDIADHPNYQLIVADICDAAAVSNALEQFRPNWIMHLAAESHVDRSIDGPGQFIQTNIVGTYNLLQAALHYWQSLDPEHQQQFRFLHVSTDEVYGSLGETGLFTESTAYDPHSPYSASKAASDHLVRAWHDTYRLPVLITNCSNNYGPYQFPEKLIPVVILKCLRNEPIPVYGQGENVRDWLYVEDHCQALLSVIGRGRVGQTYNIGGNNEMRNIDLVHTLCDLMDELAPTPDHSQFSSVNPNSPNSNSRSSFNPNSPNSNSRSSFDPNSPNSNSRSSFDPNSPRPASGRGVGGEGRSYSQLITFVADRPGHDLRYAIDSSKLQQELGWRPQQDRHSGFRKTVEWYLSNADWWQQILSGDYKLDGLGTVLT